MSNDAPALAAPPTERKTTTKVDVRCPRCHSHVEVEVTATHRVEHRRGQDVVRKRHTAPGVCECTRCWTKFRLHLFELPSGQVQLVAGVKLA